MATSTDDMSTKLTFRKYKEGENEWKRLDQQIFEGDASHKCPTYVHQTPPCQGSCPSGEDIRGWLQIVRGIEKPSEGTSMAEYAFRRSTDANPSPPSWAASARPRVKTAATATRWKTTWASTPWSSG